MRIENETYSRKNKDRLEPLFKKSITQNSRKNKDRLEQMFGITKFKELCLHVHANLRSPNKFHSNVWDYVASMHV